MEDLRTGLDPATLQEQWEADFNLLCPNVQIFEYGTPSDSPPSVTVFINPQLAPCESDATGFFGCDVFPRIHEQMREWIDVGLVRKLPALLVNWETYNGETYDLMPTQSALVWYSSWESHGDRARIMKTPKKDNEAGAWYPCVCGLDTTPCGGLIVGVGAFPDLRQLEVHPSRVHWLGQESVQQDPHMWYVVPRVRG